MSDKTKIDTPDVETDPTSQPTPVEVASDEALQIPSGEDAKAETFTPLRIASREQIEILQATLDEALALLRKAANRSVPAELDIRIYRGPSGKLLVPVEPGEALVVTKELRASLAVLEAGRHEFEPYTSAE